MALIGHIFPVYIGFKGGKGVATALGVFILIAPYEAAICAGVFLIVLFLMRLLTISAEPGPFFKGLQKRLGLASSSAAVAFPITTVLLEPSRTIIVVISIIVALLLIFQHRSNLIKILKGDHS